MDERMVGGKVWKWVREWRRGAGMIERGRKGWLGSPGGNLHGRDWVRSG